MGKSNKGNRTKGNTRPSSSGHSAELLGLSVGFVGFDGGKDAATYVPVTGQGEAADTSVDSEFRMVMRKMLKRDAVTRLKAVQEFGTFCDEKEKETVKNVLPFWPRLFNKLALDIDRRVREGSHLASGKLLAKVGRDIAPHLKNVMAALLLGQCDTYAPSSSAAQATFEATFPQKAKRQEAVIFCKDEILAYFKDNLFEQTAKSMSEPNPTNPEDVESRYHLVVGATIQGLKLFFQLTAPKTEESGILEELRAIVQDARFWKYAKHKEPQIRGSWFSLVSALCQGSPAVFEGTEKKLATAVFSQLSESDPLVAPSVWECALAILQNKKECWQLVNVRAVTLPQLWLMLRGGGQGNAHAIYPCLLPFISRLPEEIVHSDNFLNQFFSSLRQGIAIPSVKLAITECDAILNAFFECMQFICYTRLGDKEGPKILAGIMENEVIPLLDASLNDEGSMHLAITRLYPLISLLVNQAERKEGFSPVVDAFWRLALPIMRKSFDHVSEEDREKKLPFLNYIFHSLLQAKGQKEKKTVQFKDESETEEPQAEEVKSSPTPSALAAEGSTSLPYIVMFSVVVCEEVEKGCRIGYLKLLDEILYSASSKVLLTEIAKKLSKGERCDVVYIQEVLLKWVEEWKEDGECVNVLLDVVLIVCPFLSSEEVSAVLGNCCKIDLSVVERLLQRGLAVCRASTFFREWLASGCCSSEIVQCLKDVVENKIFMDDVPLAELEVCKRTISMCLLDRWTVLLLDEPSYVSILTLLTSLADKIFTSKMKVNNARLALDFYHDLVVDIMKNHQRSYDATEATQKLVYELYTFSLRDTVELEDPDEVVQVVFSALDACIFAYCRWENNIARQISLVGWMADEISTSLTTMIEHKEHLHVLEHARFLLSSVWKVLQQHKPSESVSICHFLVQIILPKPQEWNVLTKDLAVTILPFFLRGQVFFPLNMNEKLLYLKGIVQRFSLVVETVCEIVSDPIFEFGQEDGIERKFRDDYIVDQMPYVIWCLSFCRGTKKKQKMGKRPFESILEERCFKILSLLPKNRLNDLTERIFYLALDCDQWAVCLRTLADVFPSELMSTLAEEQLKSDSVLNKCHGTAKYVIRQILIPYLPPEKKKLHFEELLHRVSTMEDLEDKNFAATMAEVCCYFQDSELLQSLELQSTLLVLYRNMAPYLEQSKDDDDLRMTFHLQMEVIFSSAVKHNFRLLNSEVWDFFVEQLNALFETIYSETLRTPRSLLALHRTLGLFVSLSRLHRNSLSEQGEETLLDWKPPPLAKDTCDKMIDLFTNVTMKETLAYLPQACNLVLSGMVECVEYLSPEDIHRTLFSAEDKILLQLIKLLSSTIRHFQQTAHYLLIKVMPLLASHLTRGLFSEEDTEEVPFDAKAAQEANLVIPAQMIPWLHNLSFLNEVVESMLLELKIGDVCTVMPYTDAYSLSMAYLLEWTHLLEFISSSPAQVRLCYAKHLTHLQLLPSMFSNVFRMMPDNPATCIRKRAGKEGIKQLFLHPPQLHKDDSPSSEEIQSVACYVFATALRKMPASIRTWWNNLDRKSADIVNNFTSKYVSSHLCVAEIQAVHENEKHFENLSVQARLGPREVVATYTIDECSMELSVQLPPNHPLGPIQVERKGRGGIGEQEWRHWLLQLTTLLSYQNGSILDGLSLWKRNLDKKFEGVEECMICYMILHSTNLKLPRLSCSVCRKKFHSACLYKWFRSSNNSTCPLCRNEFSMYM